MPKKKTLFISYCWSDGGEYADALQAQLVDYFDVKRDKTQLNASDDIYSFMAEIALQDYVLIVLTPNYVKSTNCMLEVWFLLQQPDWTSKVVALVIDDSIYSTERKLEILTSWKLKLQHYAAQKDLVEVGTTILQEEFKKLEQINSCLESFLNGISRINNPSQIAIVNEMARKAKKDEAADKDKELLSEKEKRIIDFIQAHGNVTMDEILNEMGISKPYAARALKAMSDKRIVKITYKDETTGQYVRKKQLYSIIDPNI